MAEVIERALQAYKKHSRQENTRLFLQGPTRSRAEARPEVRGGAPHTGKPACLPVCLCLSNHYVVSTTLFPIEVATVATSGERQQCFVHRQCKLACHLWDPVVLPVVVVVACGWTFTTRVHEPQSSTIESIVYRDGRVSYGELRTSYPYDRLVSSEASERCDAMRCDAMRSSRLHMVTCHCLRVRVRVMNQSTIRPVAARVRGSHRGSALVTCFPLS